MNTIGGFDFEFDTIYKYNVPRKEEVAEPDQQKIIEIIKSKYEIDISGMDWLWESAQKDANGYTGSFPKRLVKFVYNLKDETGESKKVKIHEKDLSAIGQLAKANIQTERTLYFAITNHLDWKPGDYADDGSCMFNSYSAGRLAMEDQGGMAIQLFEFSPRKHKAYYHLKYEEFSNLGHPYGIGRCWFLPQYLNNNNNDNSIYVFFNHYGPVSTFTISRMVATLCGYPSKRIDQLRQNKDNKYSVYININYAINRGGCDAYIMCGYELMKDLESMGLSITG